MADGPRIYYYYNFVSFKIDIVTHSNVDGDDIELFYYTYTDIIILLHHTFSESFMRTIRQCY